MAKLTVKINGVDLNKSLSTLELLRDLVTTQNPGADTPYNALTSVKGKDGQNIPGESVLAVFEASQDSSDTIQIYEDEKLTGESTFGKMIAYGRICLSRANWKPITYGVKKVKTNDAGFDWE